MVRRPLQVFLARGEHHTCRRRLANAFPIRLRGHERRRGRRGVAAVRRVGLLIGSLERRLECLLHVPQPLPAEGQLAQGVAQLAAQSAVEDLQRGHAVLGQALAGESREVVEEDAQLPFGTRTEPAEAAARHAALEGTLQLFVGLLSAGSLLQ